MGNFWATKKLQTRSKQSGLRSHNASDYLAAGNDQIQVMNFVASVWTLTFVQNFHSQSLSTCVLFEKNLSCKVRGKNTTSQELVSQVRAGLNNNVTCPKELHLTVTSLQCPPGGVFAVCSLGCQRSEAIGSIGCWDTTGPLENVPER